MFIILEEGENMYFKINVLHLEMRWRKGGHIVSVLTSRSSSLSSSTSQGHYAVFLGKALHLVPLSTKVYKWVPVNLMLGISLQWSSMR